MPVPRLYAVTLPVTDLAAAQRFYSALLGDEGDGVAAGLHRFAFLGAALVLRERRPAVPPHGEPVCLGLETSMEQLHYRARTLGAQVDALQHMPEGEYGFRLVDPWGNALVLVDAHSVPWQSLRKAGGAFAKPAGVAAPVADAGELKLERDFINAVKGGDLETVQQLLEIDPGLVEATDPAGVSAMLHAAYKQHPAVAELLLAQNHDLNLWEAAAFGRLERLQALLERGFRVTVWSPDGFTPLGLACFFGHPACVKLLLERGADPNAPSNNDMRVQPLHSAIARAPEEAAIVIVRALIAKGASVDATQQGGYTPLHQAADRGLESVVKLLLSAGARRDAPAANGRTPADHARLRGHTKIVALLSA